ncbi:unnamed protein product [Anisakis simplex]|uniref:SERPIN domain-containing protein n=1 Tax=Anisakis simplex TaxID=6269 RepID=A0A0M3JYY7_ANISI|nr:unnamed protein product [Anisakis simplex]
MRYRTIVRTMMKQHLGYVMLWTLLAGFIVTNTKKFTRDTMPGAQYYDGKKMNIPISNEAGKELLERWARQSISSIMSSIATERSEHLNEFHRNKLFKCSNRAENLQEHAKCVVDTIDARPQKSTHSNLINVEGIQSSVHDMNTFQSILKGKFDSLNRISRNFMKDEKAKKDERRGEKLMLPNETFETANLTADLKQQTDTETMRLLREAMQLAMTLSGHNESDIANKTIKVASPRLLSIVPEDNTVSLFSPSIFSLHEKGDASEVLVNLPKLLRKMNKDHNEWMDFVLEASGVSDVIEYMKENFTEISSQEGARKVEVFESLSEGLTRKQLDDFKRKGFSVLTKDQLGMIYGENSPFNDRSSLERFSSFSEDDIVDRLLSDIRHLANPIQQTVFKRRKRQSVLSPVLFQLITNRVSSFAVLSPILLSASISAPSILGPVILSPYLFFPAILSPVLLSPIILSPYALSPLILSPLLFRPTVLSPQALNPLILSPSILSPFILSPNVLSPVILSPFALNPSVFQKSALGAVILSPFLLSPLFFSPLYYSLIVLSPYAFSPAINSTGTATSHILSPSIFS